MQHSTRPPNLQTASLFSNLGGWSNLALRGDCKPGGQERQHSAQQQRWMVLLNMFFSCRYSTRTKYMKESETDEILFSNISYLKQFRLNKMGAEVVISDRFLISKFLKGLTHCAMFCKSQIVGDKNFMGIYISCTILVEYL